ncbi:hypothetical protein K5549_004488 [Capra hircus]|nr:hypothetical protein K5549_004488 [Capra hircus]
MNFSTLRNIQRPFVPLKLQMEFEAAQAQRPPFLPSSNLSPDIRKSRLEKILNDLSQSALLEEPP